MKLMSLIFHNFNALAKELKAFLSSKLYLIQMKELSKAFAYEYLQKRKDGEDFDTYEVYTLPNLK